MAWPNAGKMETSLLSRPSNLQGAFWQSQVLSAELAQLIPDFLFGHLKLNLASKKKIWM